MTHGHDGLTGFKFAAGALALLLTSGMATADEGYPTLERVDHVLTCMGLHGGQNIDTLYACACEVDVIMQQMSFDDFNEARTYEQFKRMPGDKGGIFRESERGDELLERLSAVRADATKRCFVSKRAEQPKPPAAAGAAAP